MDTSNDVFEAADGHGPVAMVESADRPPFPDEAPIQRFDQRPRLDIPSTFPPGSDAPPGWGRLARLLTHRWREPTVRAENWAG
jgi:hypothetical protein